MHTSLIVMIIAMVCLTEHQVQNRQAFSFENTRRVKNGLHRIRGHPFMTSTQRGMGLGSGGRMLTGGSSPMWTSTQKIKIRVY